MEILEPKPPGTLWATPGLLRDCFNFLLRNVIPCGWMYLRLGRDRFLANPLHVINHS